MPKRSSNPRDINSLAYTVVAQVTGGESVQSIALSEQVNQFLHAALSNNSRRSYQSDLAHFLAWGGVIPATDSMLSEYLAAHASLLSTATLARRLVSISRAHTSQGLDSPTKSDLVKATFRGIRRIVGSAQRQVSPVLKSNLLEMVAELSGTKGTRDRALLLIGFAGALRRSELVGIQYADIEFVEHGLLIHLRRSKTDQLGKGRKIAVPHARGAVCAVQALKNWLAISHITEGPLFRPVTRHGHIHKAVLSPQAVAEIVKKRVSAIGLDASKFSGHSLRAGLVTIK